MSTFAELLKQYTARTGISDSELARAIGVRRQTVFRWKEGLSERPRQRDDVLRCATKLRLAPAETDALLLAAGFAPLNAPEPSLPAAPVGEPAPAAAGIPIPPTAPPQPPALQAPSGAAADSDLAPPAATAAPTLPAGPVLSLGPAEPATAPVWPLTRRSLWPLLAGLLTVFLLGVLWMQQNRASDNNGSVPTARPGQALILLASRMPFTLASEGSQASAAVQTGLQRELNAARLGTTSELHELPAVVQGMDDANAVRARAQASLLLWREDARQDAEVGFPDDKQPASFVVLAAAAPPAVSTLDALLAAPSALPLPIHASRAPEVRALALVAVAQLTMQQGDWDQATAAANQALAQAPGEDEATASLAFLAAYISQRKQPAALLTAVARYSQTIALTPARPEAYLNRGLAYVHLNQPTQWQADFATLLAQQPDHAGALAALCWAHALDDQPAQALPYCDQAITHRASAAAYEARALARAEQGNLAGAAQDLQAFLNWLAGQQVAGRNALESERREWLRALQNGQNPFDEALRARLRAS